jgi:hypothetical protein
MGSRFLDSVLRRSVKTQQVAGIIIIIIQFIFFIVIKYYHYSLPVSF